MILLSYMMWFELLLPERKAWKTGTGKVRFLLFPVSFYVFAVSSYTPLY